MWVIELIKCFQTEFSLVVSIFCGVVGWFANVIWESSKYKREQKTYYWKEKINAGKKATEFYLEYINLLTSCRIQFKLYKENRIEDDNLLVIIQQKNIEFQSQKLRQFPHYEYHHINLFYNLIDDQNFLIAHENSEILKKIDSLNHSKDLNDNEIRELWVTMADNYEKLYNNVLIQIQRVRADLINEVK